ncbi:unnamed protein product [Tenebrio molitor]|nr:unnamed protein product [Tenebrio molitor]
MFKCNIKKNMEKNFRQKNQLLLLLLLTVIQCRHYLFNTTLN